jgi:hypothetical protein
MKRLDLLDPERLRLSEEAWAAFKNTTPKRPPRHHPGERFLCGPVPWEWLRQAGTLPGKALLVGLALWFLAGCLKRREVRFSKTRAVEFGCHPNTVRRGIHALEAARLVRVARRPGHGLLVTLLDVADLSGADCQKG